jgi:hypothetical protein
MPFLDGEWQVVKVAESEQNFIAHRERVCATISPNVGARFGDLSKLIQLN